jgi:biopolymer transport protein ExbD
MAGRASVYAGEDDEDGGAITDINITPFVDVVLVLLVIFIVTAKLIVARGIDVEKPTDPSGGDVSSTLRVVVDATGTIYVNGDHFPDDDAAIARIKTIAGQTSKPKAIITGDRHAEYDGVMHAIGLVTRAGVKAIALENTAPPKP